MNISLREVGKKYFEFKLNKYGKDSITFQQNPYISNTNTLAIYMWHYFISYYVKDITYQNILPQNLVLLLSNINIYI